MKKLDVALYATVVANAPLICIDLLIRNKKGEVLLGKRTNLPARGMWFVPGGSIKKDEPLRETFARLTLEELGTVHPMADSRFLGVYEHFYPNNFSGEGFSTHAVVLAFELTTELSLDHLPQDQHEKFQWWEPAALLGADEVHLHTKWYLDRKAPRLI